MTSTIQSAPIVGASSQESDSPSDPSSSRSAHEALDPEPEPEPEPQLESQPAPIAKTVVLPLVNADRPAASHTGRPSLHALDGGLLKRGAEAADELAPEIQASEPLVSEALVSEALVSEALVSEALAPEAQMQSQEDRLAPKQPSETLAAAATSDPLPANMPSHDKPASDKPSNREPNKDGLKNAGSGSDGGLPTGASSEHDGDGSTTQAMRLTRTAQALFRALSRGLARLLVRLPRPELRWHRATPEPDQEAKAEQTSEAEEATTTADAAELLLLANIRALRTARVEDVRVPRADIAFITNDMSLDDIVAKAKEAGHSRFPVMGEDQDEVLGMIHIKDLLWGDVDGAQFRVQDFMRDVLFVAPSMPVLQLLQDMQVKRHHMALIVDEFGGIDGLVTIEDLVEEIVGDISDEYDTDREPALVPQADGTWIIDARYRIDELEALIGSFLTADEQEEDIDTLGGLLTHIAGRVPTRSELIEHASGMRFQVVDADPRRIKRLRMRAKSLAGAKGLMTQSRTQKTEP